MKPMQNTEKIPARHTPHEREITRLTTPISFRHGNAYDSENNVLDCVETFSEFKHYIEPKPGILSEDEILKYARHSKAASLIRLQRGAGDFEDRLMINRSLPWFMGMYYVFLLCLAVPVAYYANGYFIALIVAAVIPLLYAFYVFKLKTYSHKPQTKQIPKSQKPAIIRETAANANSNITTGIPSLKKYEGKVNDLKVLFEVKEKNVRELIEKRFEPPQITYDRFMSSIDSCHNVFYSNADAALNIVNLAAEDTPRVEKELDDKISSLEAIIDQIEDLTNELVINISSDKNSNEDLKNVLNEMEDLVESVKDY